MEDALAFLDALQAHGTSSRSAFLTSVAERDEGVEFGYTMLLRRRAGAAGEES